MIGHMKNADGSINNKNVVLSAACEAAELFQCMMAVNQKLEDWQRFNHTLEMHLRSVECEKIHDICQAVYGMKHPSNELEGLYLAREDEQMGNWRDRFEKSINQKTGRKLSVYFTIYQ